jgi:hypothetical protein
MALKFIDDRALMQKIAARLRECGARFERGEREASTASCHIIPVGAGRREAAISWHRLDPDQRFD